MKIELIDLKKRYKEEREELLSIFDRVLKNGSLILTDEVKNFEKKICDYTNSKYCLGLNSGTDALMMALWSIGIKRGDEIITSGGIIGIVDRVMEDDRIEVILTDNVKVQVIKSTITSLLKKEEIKK